MSSLKKEVLRRRTFAIISHPDAGKTTLTEKLLLYGGAIRMAGSIRSRKTDRHAKSDWMEIEKQRGISVTSSVMQFEYNNHCINILDTPGHQDFSEDTYRTLMAADSAVMLIDGAKGVEPQTIKLFHVCKMRGIPIFTFINKMDRASRDPFELMDEIENVLGIKSYPMNWPIGIDGDFKGVFNRIYNQVELFENTSHGQSKVKTITGKVDDKEFNDILGDYYYNRLNEEIELLDIAGDKFSENLLTSGKLTPLFFGSAMTNFGVEPFLNEFLRLAPPPLDRKTQNGTITPASENFSGFVFKIQANMNPAHRDRLAFLRICSGEFEKGMTAWHLQGNKEIRLSQPQQFMAQERTIIEKAYPGDIIGLFDPGIFNIGDTISKGNKDIQFDKIPQFPSECFARIAPKNSMKRKQFLKGITQLSQEGAIQIFRQPDIGIEAPIAGVVGVLQFEVLSYRLKNEYSVDLKIDNLSYRHARWIVETPISYNELNLPSTAMVVCDKDKNFVILFENDWSISWALEKNKGLKLTDIS